MAPHPVPNVHIPPPLAQPLKGSSPPSAQQKVEGTSPPGVGDPPPTPAPAARAQPLDSLDGPLQEPSPKGSSAGGSQSQTCSTLRQGVALPAEAPFVPEGVLLVALPLSGMTPSHPAAPLSANPPMEEDLIREGQRVWDVAVSPPPPTWKQWLLERAKDLAVASVTAGLTAAAPEVAPAIPELTLTAEDGLESAASWASLDLPVLAPQPPTTLAGLEGVFRRALCPPKALNLNLPDYELAERIRLSAEDERRNRTLQIIAWLSRLDRARGDTIDYAIGLPSSTRHHPLVAHDHHSDHGHSHTGQASGPHHSRLNDIDSKLASKGFVKKSEGIWVKTGDHSITAQGITSSLLLDDTSTEAGPGNFIQSYGAVMRMRQNNFDYEANQAIRVGSHLCVSAPGNGNTPSVIHWGRVLLHHEASIAVGEPLVRHDLHVHSDPACEIGQFMLAQLADFQSAGVTNEKAVSNAIQPELNITSRAAMTALTSCLERGRRWFDNQMLYAKLFYWAMVIDMFGFSNTQAVATANPPAGNPEWVDISGVNFEPHILPNIIVSCKIVLIDGVDIPYSTSKSTRRLLCWLAWAGSRVDGAEDNATPHACYMQWPAIPIVVLGRLADAPAIPAGELIRFAMGLADRRQEWSSLNRGLYAAMDQIGMRFNGVAGHFWPLKSDLSPLNPTLPAPRDYNFMFRVLQKYPEVPSREVKAEATFYSTLNSNDRVRTFALYTAVRATATTTFLYDLNLRISDLNQWTGGGR